MAFSQKIIQVSVSSTTTAAAINVSGLRTFCHVVAAGNNTIIECDVLIYGLPLEQMNQLSTLGWKQQKIGDATVDVYAGDAATGMSHVYKGSIYAAYSDYQGGPNVPFHIVAHAGTKEAAMNAPPTSINNKSADVGGMMSQLAGQMGLQFENNGVNVKIAYPYLPGSLRRQAWQLAKHANIFVTIDRGTLAIWPNNGSRSQNATVSPQTGLVGYPAWSSEGIRLKMLYNPNLAFGGQITVQGSSVTPANGTWNITRLEHSLQAFTPDGEWFSTVQGAPSTGGPALAGSSSGGV